MIDHRCGPPSVGPVVADRIGVGAGRVAGDGDPDPLGTGDNRHESLRVVGGGEHRWQQPRRNQIDEAASEFPQIDPRYAMHEHTVGFYTSPEGGEGEMYNAVGRFDLTNNRGERHSFGPRETTFTSEAIFVPKNENAAEGEGYLLSVVTDRPSDTSSLAILDAENVSAGPLAMAELGHRVPVGFHGGWRPAEG